MSGQYDDQQLMQEVLQMLCQGRENGEPEVQPDGPAAAFIQFMDKMPGGFLIYRAGGDEEILYANEAVLRIFQCSSMDEFREHTGNSFRGLVHPGDLDEVEESIQTQICTSQYDLDYVEYRILRRDGAVRWIEDYGHFVRNETWGDIFYVFLGDATEKRERSLKEKADLVSEQQDLLADALAKANLAIASKNTFLSNMSHDMRTPLHAIFGFTSLAKLNIDNPEEAMDYLERVEAASRQLLDMIDKVLEASSLSGSSDLREAECDLRDVLQNIYDFLQPQAKEKNITFTLDCARLRQSTVIADPEKLRQLVLYLANNAVTYTKPGGRVSIVGEELQQLPHDYVAYRIVVTDTGIGINSEFLEKVFEPFSREKNSTLSGVHGIGLGLTIAKSIVDMMGGTLDAKSEEGKGSTFTATLTLRTLDSAPAVQEPAAPVGSVQRILLAEDNDINREIEVELLARMGFMIDPAENGQEALEKVTYAAPGYYDLILLDLQMPVMDGWQAAKAIRSLPEPGQAKIPIVALSANVLESDQLRSRECGIDAHLIKPMDLALLLKTIEELTGKKRPEKPSSPCA